MSHPNVVATRAIGIEVPPARVWPWLVQIGQDRAGFYSYDKLENLAGCDIHSVDRIVPEWQQLQLGDSVTLEPGVQLRVAELEIARHLVLAGRVPLGPALIPAEFSWSFLLQERPAGATRLLSRVRYAHLRWWSPPMVEAVEIIDTIMTRRMLRAIKALAERDSDSEQRRPQ